jgi:hypothetical protein
MTTRKKYLGGALIAVLVLTAGCSGLLGENQSFDASEITVSNDSLSETGYTSAETEEYTFEETFGNDTEVSITSRLSGYETEYDSGPGYFVGLATPKSEIAGVEVNPLGDYDEERLVARAMSRSDEADVDVDEEDLETVGNTSVTILDSDATVTTYSTTLERGGVEGEALIHVTRMEHGGDYLIAVGIHPEAAADGETDIIALFESIEHDDGE